MLTVHELLIYSGVATTHNEYNVYVYFEGPRMAYTDDTAMSIAVARTLIERREIGR